ncbi:MAG TPA: CHAD domain-containing protein [Candidatus Eremiobacteraceae bacterium]|nr:CHAD domain-containing protein [Candidatus Eremiobacteraceae bacterium]
MPSTSPTTRAKRTTGLRYWMLRVLEECDNVAADFGSDPVHDLRVSLRRCRSLADGLMALDPDPDWKAMKKAGKRLFQRLGDLRDIHVMEEWVERLTAAHEDTGGSLASPPSQPDDDSFDHDSLDHDSVDKDSMDKDSVPDAARLHSDEADPAAHALLKILADREQEQKHAVKAALEEFDRKQWRQWSNSLPTCAARIRPGSALFKHLALERWTEARKLHSRALRNRSQSAFHSLRIGIKRFRYIVENFLPAEHKKWSDDLKEMQDLLGEVHDLDVLWTTAVACHIFPDVHSRQLWHKRILSERSKRIDRYRAKMIGPHSLWQVWRAGLPQGKQIQELATRRMKLWAGGLDPDFPHSERVATLALQLYDGLLASAWQPAVDGISARSSLLAAALLHDVGKSKGEKGHHKASLDLIREHGNPLGWKEADLRRAAVVARFHRGILPTRKHKSLRDLLPDEQRAIIQLAAILRLANSLDATHDGHIHRIQIENGNTEKVQGKAVTNRKHRVNGFLRKTAGLVNNGALVIAAEGYSPLGSSAQTIAAERHLLETVLRRPVVVKPLKNSRLHYVAGS